MLRTMRENTKWIMLVTALAFIGLMVFERGMDLSGRSSAQANGGEIGRINGEPISYEEFLNVYRGLYQQQQQFQQEPIGAAQNRQIEEAAWEQLVMEHLIQQEIKARKLKASDEEVRQAARFAPPPEFYNNELFHTNGQFDLAKYQQFLASPAVDNQLLMQLEAYYRDLISRNKLFQQVASGAFPSDDVLWRTWQDQNERIRVRYAVLEPEVLVSDAAVSVSDQEVAAFYKAHRNDFQRPARASVKVVALAKAATAADTAAAKERALKVRAEIAGGADFATVARRESADRGSAERGGDLGAFGRGQMVPAFDQAVWSLKVNELSQPVETPFGYHIIQVTSRTGDEAHARHILIPIQRSDATEDALLERADSLEHLASTTSLEEAASKLGLSVRNGEITPELPIVAGVGQIDDGADWAFHDAETGEKSSLFETPGGFYVVELVKREPAGTLSLQEATPMIRDRQLAQKKLEEARKIGRDVVEQAQRSSLEEAARARGLQVAETEPFARGDFVPGLGRANAAIGAGFGLEIGKTSELVEANERFYVIQTLSRTEADRAAFDAVKEPFRQQVAQGMEQERWSLFLASLKEKAKIVDHRAEVLSSSRKVATN